MNHPYRKDAETPQDADAGPTVTMRSGTGNVMEEFEGVVVVDETLNEVVLLVTLERETPAGWWPALRSRNTRIVSRKLTCGALVPLDFRGRRCRVTVEWLP